MSPRLDYLKAFAKSGIHGTLALLTLGVGFASGHPLGLVIGATAYLVGWVCVGDSAWFRRRIDQRNASALHQQESQELGRLQAERAEMIRTLPLALRQRYEALVEVCRDIEAQFQKSPEMEFELGRLDGLMWSFLGLLANEAHLATFIERERSERFPQRIAELEAELRTLNTALGGHAPGTPAHEARLQLIASRQEGLDALRQRHQQFERSEENLALVRAEQDRITQQLKLVRADLFAAKSVGQISLRINETLDSLTTTSRLGGESMPALRELPTLRSRRLGYEAASES